MTKPDLELLDLLKTACPSIQYRVRHDLFDFSIDLEEMQLLQEDLLLDPLVKGVIDSQSDDGWFGPRFHGYDSFESGIRILIEKGVSLQHSALCRAMDALEHDTDRIAKDLGSFGQFFDDHRLGGARMIQASLLSQGGRSNNPLVAEQIEVALEGMRSVLTVHSFEEATETKRNKLVFKTNIQWPGIYHLRLLAYTQQWRTPENLLMVTNSINHMVQLSPMPYAHAIKSSQLIAPASFAMLDFNPDLGTLDAPGWMMWFHRTELLAGMGISSHQIDYLKGLLSKNGGIFALPLKHDYFKRWGAYTGLMLEPDWKTPQRRTNDLTFRSYLILHKIQAQEKS
jgi:hypothetical protein